MLYAASCSIWCICVARRETAPQPRWFSLTQTLLCSCTRCLLRLNSSAHTKTCLALLRHLQGRSSVVAAGGEEKRNKEPFECELQLSGRNKATHEKKKRGHHSDFILFTLYTTTCGDFTSYTNRVTRQTSHQMTWKDKRPSADRTQVYFLEKPVGSQTWSNGLRKLPHRFWRVPTGWFNLKQWKMIVFIQYRAYFSQQSVQRSASWKADVEMHSVPVCYTNTCRALTAVELFTNSTADDFWLYICFHLYIFDLIR